MQYCVKPIKSTLIGLLALSVAGCQQAPVDYGFTIKDVSVSRGYQTLDIHLQQELNLSQQAREALEYGVTLTIRLEIELRNDNNMIVVRREARSFHIRYLPLIQRYQVRRDDSETLQTFPRLRHVLASINQLTVQIQTGPLPSGNYELRTRVRLDEGLLPAPMQLPALFSSQWRHDSEWSVWPFKVSV